MTMHLTPTLPDNVYFDLIDNILAKNTGEKDNRTDTPTIGIIGHFSKYEMVSRYVSGDLRVYNFPLLTTKKVNFRSILAELIWFINGQTNIRFLEKNGVGIWTQWPHRNYNTKNPHNQLTLQDFRAKIINDAGFANEWGELGPVYGSQWRQWETQAGNPIDQFQNMLDTVKNSPASRRNIVTAWNPAEIDEMSISGLPPCHTLWQVSYTPDANTGSLDLTLTQRSADSFLGVPFNIASYSLLLAMIAEYSGKTVRAFNHFITDGHIYINHIDQIKQQRAKEPFNAPSVLIKHGFLSTLLQAPLKSEDLDLGYFSQFVELEKYVSHEYIKGEVAI